MQAYMSGLDPDVSIYSVDTCNLSLCPYCRMKWSPPEKDVKKACLKYVALRRALGWNPKAHLSVRLLTIQRMKLQTRVPVHLGQTLVATQAACVCRCSPGELYLFYVEFFMQTRHLITSVSFTVVSANYVSLCWWFFSALHFLLCLYPAQSKSHFSAAVKTNNNKKKQTYRVSLAYHQIFPLSEGVARIKSVANK